MLMQRSLNTNANDLNPIVQEETGGCAIASVAVLAGLSYGKVKALANSIGISASDTKLYSETGYVRRLFKEYNIKARAKELPFSSWDALPELALLSIKYRQIDGRPFWHWVVFTKLSGKAVVLDPAMHLKDHTRTDFYRIKPRWYIEIIQDKAV